MALKLDMRKAYDMIEWNYLRAIMLKTRLDRWWVHSVMTCVDSVSYNFVHGRYKIETILQSWGIKQVTLYCLTFLSFLLKVYQ